MTETFVLLLLFGLELLTRTVLTLPAFSDIHNGKYLKQATLPTWNAESTGTYWLQSGKEFVEQQLTKANQPQRDKAKNIILFLGSGMSLTTLAATRIYNGDQSVSLAFELFSDTGLAKTYALDRMVPDAASAATALLCGVKTRFGTIGVNGHIQRGDCMYAKQKQHYVDSIAKWALDSSKSVGFVTTTRVTEATTAALYAHSSERHWENDAELHKDCGVHTSVEDIASQLINGDIGRRLKVVLGGGRADFIDRKLDIVGERRDGRNLIDEFRAADTGNIFLDSAVDLRRLNISCTNRLLGLFSDSQLPYHLEQVTDGRNDILQQQQPTLSEMTAKAMELLDHDNPNGYFLVVVNGNIDLAHHSTRAKLALDETAELSKAVELARKATDSKQTLIVVSADHSHTMSIAGYSPRGYDIFGTSPTNASDDKPYHTLSYANGPGFNKFYNTKKNCRENPKNFAINNFDSVFPATVPLRWETHGGEDVPVFASGPWSHLFSGVYEQSTIPHLMAFAGCLGANGQMSCENAN